MDADVVSNMRLGWGAAPVRGPDIGRLWGPELGSSSGLALVQGLGSDKGLAASPGAGSLSVPTGALPAGALPTGAVSAGGIIVVPAALLTDVVRAEAEVIGEAGVSVEADVDREAEVLGAGRSTGDAGVTTSDGTRD